ncbi:hypothetical protein CEUSTIGMA_g5124.t1 [Chlamydomonas eustigma]|uniref:Protein kinase domain-containing protein n=1 Tax=Chlamydomonas eustigma TaxID=1157962 RepID=A0A250X3P5_9CHLO|nr:hypothetical protein CEUSTIGMA_g5124.t1 [Chlamydomonas eustigma]|eukprot:GAX77681.1 hypothetical protein CEUSTIGMA_g5124.t1 [Chlamydomonas eustigma]
MIISVVSLNWPLFRGWMGQCMSTANGAADGQRPIQSGKAEKYLDSKTDENKAIIEGLAGAYKVLKLLGSGAEGNTYLVQDCNTNQNWAIKLIKLPLPTRFVQAIFREIKLQSELGEGHNNIITPEEVVLTSHYLGLVMEFAPGGSLTSFITQRFRECKGVGLLMPEDEALYFFKQLVNAVDYCHRHHVVHRDLKLDNTLLSGTNPPLIKLCDFGFARGWGDDSHFTTVIGTPDYMSPQITAAKAQGKALYDGTKADVWAMGVLLCVSLIGKFPFEGDSVSTMGVNDPMKKIWVQQNKSTWSNNSLLKDQLPYLSAEVMDLLDKVFELDEQKRIDVKGIKAHPWFNKAMRPELEAATAKLEADQLVNDKKVASGAYHSKRRDAAISNLIKLAASDEFRKRATEPVTEETTFQIWSRIGLRTALEAYPVFDKKSLKNMLSFTDGFKQPSIKAA